MHIVQGSGRWLFAFYFEHLRRKTFSGKLNMHTTCPTVHSSHCLLLHQSIPRPSYRHECFYGKFARAHSLVVQPLNVSFICALRLELSSKREGKERIIRSQLNKNLTTNAAGTLNDNFNKIAHDSRRRKVSTERESPQAR